MSSSIDDLKIKESYKIMWLFIIGSFFGFIAETIFCYGYFGKILDRRGTFYLFVSPIYGAAFVLAYLCLKHDFNYKLTDKIKFVKNNKVLRVIFDYLYIFLLTFVLGGLFEIILSYLQEYLFNYRSWYYDGFLCFEGRTNFLMMCFWGLIGICFVKVVYPFIAMMLSKLNAKFSKTLAIILFIAITIDILITCYATYRYKERREGDVATNVVDTFFDTTYDDDYMNAFLVR